MGCFLCPPATHPHNRARYDEACDPPQPTKVVQKRIAGCLGVVFLSLSAKGRDRQRESCHPGGSSSGHDGIVGGDNWKHKHSLGSWADHDNSATRAALCSLELQDLAVKSVQRAVGTSQGAQKGVLRIQLPQWSVSAGRDLILSTLVNCHFWIRLLGMVTATPASCVRVIIKLSKGREQWALICNRPGHFSVSLQCIAQYYPLVTPTSERRRRYCRSHRFTL